MGVDDVWSAPSEYLNALASRVRQAEHRSLAAAASCIVLWDELIVARRRADGLANRRARGIEEILEVFFTLLEELETGSSIRDGRLRTMHRMECLSVTVVAG